MLWREKLRKINGVLNFYSQCDVSSSLRSSSSKSSHDEPIEFDKQEMKDTLKNVKEQVQKEKEEKSKTSSPHTET